MTVHRKSFEVDAVTAYGDGELVAYASTFHNVDFVGDRVMPGAFDRTIAAIKAGKTLPLVWGHDYNGSPQNLVGTVYDAEEDAEGLRIHARFDLEDPVARKAHRLVKSGEITKLSIGYRVHNKRRASDGATELLDVEVHEVSLVLTPANDQARVLAIKEAAAAIVPTEAELRAEARRLGVETPLSERELRRQCDTLALDAALGFDPAPETAPADPNPVPSTSELRKEFDLVRVELALDGVDRTEPRPDPAPTMAELAAQAEALGIPGPPASRHRDYEAIRARAHRHMLDLFALADRENAA